MRASTAIALSVAAASASSVLAAPHMLTRQDESGALNLQSFENGAKKVINGVTSAVSTVAPIISGASKVAEFFAREDAELFARELYEFEARQGSDDDSGALSFQSVKNFGSDVVHDVASTINTVTPAIQAVTGAVSAFNDLRGKTSSSSSTESRREEVLMNLLARAAIDDSGALSFQSVKNFGSDVVNDVTSTLNTVTPAIQAVTGAIGAFNDFKGKTSSSSSTKSRREEVLMDLLARAAIDDSGALSFQSVKNFGSDVVNDVTSTLNTVTPAIQAVTGAIGAFNDLKGKTSSSSKAKREAEMMDLLARAAVSDTGIVGLTDIFHPGNLRGPVLLNRQATSGAINLQDVKDFGQGFVKGFTGTLKAVAPLAAAFVKREELELLAREELLRRADASGALSLQDVKDFGQGFVKGFTGTLETVAPIAAAFVKREEMELLARSALLEAYGRRSLADLD